MSECVKIKINLGLKKAWFRYSAFIAWWSVLSKMKKWKCDWNEGPWTGILCFFFFCGSANVLISREKMGSKGRYVCCGRVIPAWLNPELPLAPPRAFPGFCACREQQKCSNDNTGIAKLLGDFLFSPICEDSSALSCPGAGCSWPQGASAGRRDLLHWFAENFLLSEFICKKKCPQLLKGRAWFQGGEGLWIASFSECEICSTDLQPPIRCSVGHLFLKSWPIPRVSSKRKWWE